MEERVCLRDSLQTLASTRPTDRVYPTLWNEIVKIEGHSVRQVDGHKGNIGDFNCYAYALRMETDPTYLKMQGSIETPPCCDRPYVADSNFIRHLICRNIITRRTELYCTNPGLVELVLYYNKNEITHAARIADTRGQFESKWGSGRIYSHGPLEVPREYGDRYEVMNAPLAERCIKLLECWVESQAR